MITLEELLADGIEHAKRVVLGGDEVCGLLTFACPPDGDGKDRLVVMAVPDYGNPDKKMVVRKTMRVILEQAGAYCYAFIGECWFQTFNPKEDGGPEPGYLPSKDPYRKECITVAGSDLKGRKLMRILEIKRTPNANTKFKVKFEEFEPPEGLVEAQGPLLDLLPKQTMQ